HIADAAKTDVQLFDIPPATRWTIWNKDGNLGDSVWRAPNPPNGAVIDYYLKTDQPAASITVTDKAGKTIRTIASVPRAAGVNRYVWDLRYDPAKPGPVFGGRGGRGAGRGDAPAGEEAPGGGRFGGGGAPQVIPGEYTVQLHVGERELTKTVRVDMDPRVPVSAADLQSQLDTALTLRDMMSRANTAVDRANTLVRQLTDLQT